MNQGKLSSPSGDGLINSAVKSTERRNFIKLGVADAALWLLHPY
jgi:hypothetical protein